VKGTFCVIVFAALQAAAFAQSNVLRLDVAATRSSGSIAEQTDKAVRTLALRNERLFEAYRERRLKNLGRGEVPTMMPPARVEIGTTGTRRLTQGGDLVLVFDTTGARAFPSDYRTFLETVFANAKATMNLVFGPPSLGGQVRVSNFDADIGDRDAVAGGYYLPDNGSGEREIRFPV
jgi:hypothetical protein